MAIGRPPFFEEETLTLTGDQTLVLKDANTLLVTASGTNRNLTLPTADAAFWATGAEAKITNVGTSNNVVIKNSDATTLDTLEPGEYGRYYASNGTWHIGDSSNTATGTTDTNAIHDNVASEISALTDVEPAYGDFVLIEDASDSNNKKRVGGDRLIHANIKMPTAADDTGATDAQPALKTFFEGLSSGDTVHMTPNGLYRWGTQARINLATIDDLTIEGNNCTIFFDFDITDADTASVFHINGGRNIRIRNFNCFGYKASTGNGSDMDAWSGSVTDVSTTTTLTAAGAQVVTPSASNRDNMVGRIFEIPSASTTVDASSASGQAVLNVAATQAFIEGDSIIIDSGNANEETGIILSIQHGVSLTLTANLANTHESPVAVAVTTKARPKVRWDVTVHDGVGGDTNGCTLQIIQQYPQEGTQQADAGSTSTLLVAADAHFQRDLPEVKAAWKVAGDYWDYYVRNQTTREEALITDFVSDTQIVHAALPAGAWNAGEDFVIFGVLASQTITPEVGATTYTLRADLDYLYKGWTKGRVINSSGTNTITVTSEVNYGEQVFVSKSDEHHFVRVATTSPEGSDRDEGYLTGLVVENCWVENMYGDAVTCSRRSADNITLIDVMSRVNSRMGISLNIGHGHDLIRCKVIGAGRAAYDFETVVASSPVKQVRMIDCEAWQTRNFGINLAGAGQKEDFLIDGFFQDYSFGSSGAAMSVATPARRIKVMDNCVFQGGSAAGQSLVVADDSYFGGYWKNGLNLTGDRNYISDSFQGDYNEVKGTLMVTGEDNRLPGLYHLRIPKDTADGQEDPVLGGVYDTAKNSYMGPIDISILKKVWTVNHPSSNPLMAQFHSPWFMYGMRMHGSEVKMLGGIQENDALASHVGRNRIAVANTETSKAITFPVTAVRQPTALTLQTNTSGSGSLISSTTYYYRVATGTKNGPASVTLAEQSVATGGSDTSISISPSGHQNATEMPLYFTLWRGTVSGTYTHRVDIYPAFTTEGSAMTPGFAANGAMWFWDEGATLYGPMHANFVGPTGGGSATKMTGYDAYTWQSGLSVTTFSDETGAMPDSNFQVVYSGSYNHGAYSDPDADYTVTNGGGTKVIGVTARFTDPGGNETIGYAIIGTPDA